MNWKLLNIVFGFLHQLNELNIWSLDSGECEILAEFFYKKFNGKKFENFEIDRNEIEQVFFEAYKHVGWTEMEDVLEDDAWNIVRDYLVWLD